MTEKIHWADVIASRVDQDKHHRIATGITPSGPIHLGNMREVITGDLVYKAMVERGMSVQFIYVADDFDPLRRVYPFLPESYSQYIGMPISDIPCPCGSHGSYAEHFLEPFLSSLDELDVHPIVIHDSKMYREGKFTSEIKTAIEKREKIRRILETVSGRTLPVDWSPLYPVCSSCGRIVNVPVLTHDPGRHTITYYCDCGHEGTADYSKGEAKLVWRVDWPMRWAHCGITIEPFGKDHAAAGGSYDTGKQIVRQIYGSEPPFPVNYEWISLKGRGAMASSTGVAVSIRDMLDIVPPDVLRYLIARIKPEKAIDFDPGLGLVQLVDEFDRLATEGDSREYILSGISHGSQQVSFRHMITLVQITTDPEGICEILNRSGYDIGDRDGILAQANRAERWLARYAPEIVKFKVQDTLPPETASIGEAERNALLACSRIIENLSSWHAEFIHNAVYSAANESGIDARKLFTAIYIAVLGKKRGPRLGFFLEALGQEFVVLRLKEAGGAGAQ